MCQTESEEIGIVGCSHFRPPLSLSSPFCREFQEIKQTYLQFTTSMETLQPSLVNRELKRIIEDQYQVFLPIHFLVDLKGSTRIYSLVIQYIHPLYYSHVYFLSRALSPRANEIAKKQKKSTIQPSHIVQALEETGFASFLPDIETYVSRTCMPFLINQIEMEQETKPGTTEPS